MHPNFISIDDFSVILGTNKNSAGRVITENWNAYTNPSWYESIIEGIRRPHIILSLGPLAVIKSINIFVVIFICKWSALYRV